MSDTILERLETLNISLPKLATPVANYVPYVISGRHVYIAGQVPFSNGILKDEHRGIVGKTVSHEDAYDAARLCGLNILSQMNQALDGNLARISRCVKLGGFVTATSDFTDHPKIINGTSDLMIEVFGEDIGRHARFAVGTTSLPLGVAVEVDALFELNV